MARNTFDFFKGTRVVNAQSLEIPKPKILQFMIQHRFGSIENGFYENEDGEINIVDLVQLVNIFHGEVEDVLNTFDIENCKVAIKNPYDR